MKKIYTLGLALISSLVLSQETISFEASEGYELGTLNGQNNWSVTADIEGVFLENQILTDEIASEGTISFKNANEPEFDYQWFPIFGASLEYETPKINDNFSISYDINITELMGSDFEFTIFGKDEVEDYYPIAGIGMEYQGNIYVISSIDYAYTPIENASWQPNEWYNFKIEIAGNELKYYLNETLIFTDENYNPMKIAGFNMLHNNFGGSAYYDNFVITFDEEEEMNVSDLNANTFNIYPNPVKDSLSIQLNEKIDNIEIYSVTGQKVKSIQNAKQIQLAELASGTYIIKVAANGKVYTKKFIKA